MDLKTFVAESISQICSGIIEAQKKAEETGAIVSPRVNYFTQWGTYVTKSENPIHTAALIHFDVALSATDSLGSEKKGEKHAILEVMNVRVEAGFSSGNEAAARQEMASVSRIQFDVPVIWPPASADAVLNTDQESSPPQKTRQRSSLYENRRPQRW